MIDLDLSFAWFVGHMAQLGSQGHANPQFEMSDN
jgi:hypothetical protein